MSMRVFRISALIGLAVLGCADAQDTPMPLDTAATALSFGDERSPEPSGSTPWSLPARAGALPDAPQHAGPAADAEPCDAACNGNAGCQVLCLIHGADAMARDASSGRRFAARAKPVRPDAECLLCGRETGFMPAPDAPEPVEVSVSRDEKGGVIVAWSAYEGAEAYELWALRAQGDETPMPVTEGMVMGTSTTLSGLAEGWRWTFVVTPWVGGERVDAAQGESEPIAL